MGTKLDLAAMASCLPGAEFDPDRFPGLIYRIKDPKAATLLFSSGKVVCTGTKSLEQARVAIRKVIKQIEKADVHIKDEPDIEVQNVVATFDLGHNINLSAVALSLGLEKVEYEPEQFPGLVFRMDTPKVVLLLFGSGKVVCTGARKPKDVEEAVNNISRDLRAAGQFH